MIFEDFQEHYVSSEDMIFLMEKQKKHKLTIYNFHIHHFLLKQPFQHSSKPPQATQQIKLGVASQECWSSAESQQQSHKISNRMASNLFRHFLIFLSLVLYLLGRVCDDMNWYPYPGITPNDLQTIAISGLIASSVLIAIVQLMKQGGWKVIFYESQRRFVIPWALTILESVLVFDTFACHSDDTPLEGQDMDHKGCTLYVVALLFTNLCHSFCCNERIQFVYLIVFEISLFAEVIYSGLLLLTFIDKMKDKQKDYSILFISIMIAWMVLLMDLLFRAIYEDKRKEERHAKLKEFVRAHHETCEKHDLGLEVNYEEHKN